MCLIDSSGKSKHDATVTIPGEGGQKIYKSTLVSMMNENPQLSKDR